MNKIYDNGGILLGNIDLVIKEVQKEIEEDIDMVFVDKEELLKDLLELKEEKSYMLNNKIEIVCINYDNGSMGYSIDYWYTNDEIKEV